MRHTKVSTEISIPIWLLALPIIITAVDTDIFLPNLSDMRIEFGCSPAAIQTAMTVNFFGLCFSALCYGPLADCYGRKPILLIGLFLFTVGSFLCFISPSLDVFILSRLLQGLGGSAALIIPYTLAYDMYKNKKAIEITNKFNVLVTFSVALAPLLGSLFAFGFGWRSTFFFIGVLGLIVIYLVLKKLPETNPPRMKQQHFSLKKSCTDYKQIVHNKRAQYSLAIIYCCFAGYLVCLANYSLIFIETFSIDKFTFACLQACIILSLTFASLNASHLIHYAGLKRARLYGKLTSFSGATGLLLTAFFLPGSPLLIILFSAIFVGGFGLIMNISFCDYMTDFHTIRASAAALANTIRMAFIAMMIACSGYFFSGTILPVAVIVFTLSLTATFLCLYLHKSDVLYEQT